MGGLMLLPSFHFCWCFTSRLSSPLKHLLPARLDASNMALQPLLTWAYQIISAPITSFPSSDAYRTVHTPKKDWNSRTIPGPQLTSAVHSLSCPFTPPPTPSLCPLLPFEASGLPQRSFSLVRMLPIIALCLCTLWSNWFVLSSLLQHYPCRPAVPHGTCQSTWKPVLKRYLGKK